jgi:hypothetical protein
MGFLSRFYSGGSMTTVLIRRLAGLATIPLLAMGGIAAMQTSSVAQVTVKCWKEYCTTDPETGAEYCVKKTIDCPPEENEVRTP